MTYTGTEDIITIATHAACRVFIIILFTENNRARSKLCPEDTSVVRAQ